MGRSRSASPADRKRERTSRSRSRERDAKRSRADKDERARPDYRKEPRPEEIDRRERDREERRDERRDVGRQHGAHRDRDRERDRAKDHTDRGRDAERDRERDRDKERVKEKDRSEKDRERGPRDERDKERSAHGGERDRAASPRVKKEEEGKKPQDIMKAGSEPPSGMQAEAVPGAAVGLATASPAPDTKKQEPLSLEELLKKRKQQQEVEAKPKFLTKAERQALALAKLEAQRTGVQAAQLAKVDAARGGAGSGGLLPPPPPLPASGRDDPRDRERDRDRGRDDRGPGRSDRGRDDRGRDPRDRERDRGRDDPRDRGRDDRRGGGGAGPSGSQQQPGGAAATDRERERELELIKQQYLGQDKLKKRIVRPSEKFKFNFDWDAKEDTSRDLNPLYNNLHEAALMFGRGMRAGIDRREQKKQSAQHEADSMRKIREAAGIVETNEMRRHDKARERLADQYDKADMRVEKHWTEKALEDMAERDWRIFREDFNIGYKGVNTVLPIRNWDEGNFPLEIKQAIERVGYKKPSPIQMAAIPLGLAQRDVIGVAETGSGKTAAFVLPMLVYIMKQPPMTEVTEADGPYAVVLAPTRELAQQIEEETIKLAHFTKFRTTSVVGGQSIEEQGSKLRKGCEIVIATPGRLLDCLERHYAVLNQCNYIVLDEADRMIDLGFEPQVISVMDAMPKTHLKPEDEGSEIRADVTYRTTYMFSATMPAAVERLARKYLRRPVVITIGSAGRVTDNVSQRVFMCKENEKARLLEQEMEQLDEKRVIVFVNTQRQCDNVHRHLEEMNYRCTILHGGKSQDQREAGIKGFRDGTYNCLIATDVAGRGIDVPDVALVINYDMPASVEAYTHRIGRTGRAGKKGASVTFLTLSDSGVFFDLKKLLEDCKAAVPSELARHEASKVKPGSIEAKSRREQTVFAA